MLHFMNLHAPYVPSRPPDTIPTASAQGTHDHFTIDMLVEGLLSSKARVSNHPTHRPPHPCPCPCYLTRAPACAGTCRQQTRWTARLFGDWFSWPRQPRAPLPLQPEEQGKTRVDRGCGDADRAEYLYMMQTLLPSSQIYWVFLSMSLVSHILNRVSWATLSGIQALVIEMRIPPASTLPSCLLHSAFQPRPYITNVTKRRQRVPPE